MHVLQFLMLLLFSSVRHSLLSNSLDFIIFIYCGTDSSVMNERHYSKRFIRHLNHNVYKHTVTLLCYGPDRKFRTLHCWHVCLTLEQLAC